MKGYGHTNEIGETYETLMEEEDILRVLDFLKSGATKVHVKEGDFIF